MTFNAKPFTPYYPLWNDAGDIIAIAHSEESANATSYALGGYVWDRLEDCAHGMSASLCADPINHYPPDHY